MVSVESSPLLEHRSPSAIVAYRGGRAIAARQFLEDAARLVRRLPPGEHVLNLCLDRYRFAVGLAACLMSRRVSLLPSTHTPEVIRQLLVFASDAVCLTDEPGCNVDMPRMQFPEPSVDEYPISGDGSWSIPRIPDDQRVAIVFTSGSTGTPLPYTKTWGKLSRCIRDGAVRLGLASGHAHTLIGTVPPQHMYGFESTVLLALLSGHAFGAERPLFPADVCASVAAVPCPRALITTPVHLRALLNAGILLPRCDLIVSATAPLPLELALEIEETFHTHVLEIYGSTETGQIATRRTADSPTWRLWPRVRLVTGDSGVFAEGGHVEQRTALCDVIEIIGEEQFLLHGRTSDLVNIAGKRSSYGYLNAQLLAIPGVVDGAFLPGNADAPGTGVARLTAIVVAPALSASQLTDQLRRRIDPVFLPRPLILVDELPRNATGKLPLQAMKSMADRHRKADGAA